MNKYNEVGKHKTSVVQTPQGTYITYHRTNVVFFNTETICLTNHGWNTTTTKLRMNQASNQYNLGYTVWQCKFEWYVTFKDKTHPFHDGMTLNRKTGEVT